MKKSNYLQLKEKVEGGEVRILGIVSPPRVVSTALEILLVESPDVDGQINEPFHLSLNGHDDAQDLGARNCAEERAYGDVLRRVEEIQAETGKKNVTIVMKEMAKNVAPGAQMERWLSVTDKQVVLARNPLSNVESLIKRLSSLIEGRPDLVNVDLNKYAFDQGYKDETGEGNHWRSLLADAHKRRDYRVLGPVLESFFPRTNLYRNDPDMMSAYLDIACDEDASSAGFESLDDFAVQNGFSSWQDMRKNQDDLKAFGPVLDILFAFRNAGWESIDEHLPMMDAPIVVDTTILRARPKEVLEQLTALLGIAYDSHMVDGWSQSNGNKFDRGHGKTGHSVFIGKALESNKLNLPQEHPISAGNFPPQFRDYILETAMPVYLSVLSHTRLIGPVVSSDLQELLDTEVEEGTALEDRDPVFAYALISTTPVISDDIRDTLLGRIREDHGHIYGDAFNAIDYSFFPDLGGVNIAIGELAVPELS